MNETRIQEFDPAEQEFTLLDGSPRRKVAIVVVAALLALLSITVLSGIFSSVSTYSNTMKTLDDKKTVVMTMAATATGASTAITALPDDTGTPVAAELADLSHDLLMILTAIYLEKYLLTTFGFVTFTILIPLSCLLVIGATLLSKYGPTRRKMVYYATKLTCLGVVLVLTVPTGVFVSNMIENTHREQFEATINSVNLTTEAIEDAEEVADDTDEQGVMEFLQSKLEDAKKTASGLVEGVADLATYLKDMANNLIDAVAVMLVTSCIIPLLVLLLFLWLVRIVTGFTFPMPTGFFKSRIGMLGKRPGQGSAK